MEPRRQTGWGSEDYQRRCRCQSTVATHRSPSKLPSFKVEARIGTRMERHEQPRLPGAWCRHHHHHPRICRSRNQKPRLHAVHCQLLHVTLRPLHSCQDHQHQNTRHRPPAPAISPRNQTTRHRPPSPASSPHRFRRLQLGVWCLHHHHPKLQWQRSSVG